MENKLVMTNRGFFGKVFRKKRINQVNEKVEIKNTLFQEEISYKVELGEKQRKEKMAQKLLNGSIECEALTEVECREMIEYFTKDIEKQENELRRIKMHIIEMRKRLQSNM